MAAYEKPGFVAVITDKTGTPLHESNVDSKRTVRVPFGSEYKVRIKNKTNGRAFVRVMIDGRYTLGKPSAKLIVRAGETVDLERFVESLTEGSSFKFVEAGAPGVQDPTSGDNGRVQIIFEAEKISPSVTFSSSSGILRGAGVGMALRSMSVGGVAGAVNCSTAVNNVAASTLTSNCFHVGSPAPVDSGLIGAATSDLGATVEGSTSHQKFQDTNEWFMTEAPVVIDLWLRGPRVEAEPPRPFQVQFPLGGVPLFNGIQMTGCSIYQNGDYTHITVPSHLVNWPR